MSIILTAGKNAVKAKNKPKKHKKKKIVTHDGHIYEPPISTPKTVVWYWLLDQVPTTVMYTKDTDEVWCNGTILKTKNHFPGVEGEDVALEFLVGEHPAAIVKNILPGSCAITHQLYVDRKLIHENIGQPPEESATDIPRPTGDSVFGAQFGGTPWEQPPSYDDVVSQIPMNQYDKKNQ